jgi:hypothetical protein
MLFSVRAYSGIRTRPVKSIPYQELEACANEGHSYNSAARNLKTNSDMLRTFIKKTYPTLAEQFYHNGEVRKTHSQPDQQKYKQVKKEGDCPLRNR